MSYRNIGLRIAFDGSKYHGWQSQPYAHTAEEVIKKAIYQFEQRKTKVYAASRTDAGVHANGQYVNFHSYNLTIPDYKYAAALNSYLPSAMRIYASREHDAHFHARYSATRRTYLYQIRVSGHAMPIHTSYYLTLRRAPNVAQCNRALAALCGTHDFASFAKIERGARQSTIRTVYQACMYAQGAALCIKIGANAFLRNMVRAIVGTILDSERCQAEHIRTMLYTHDRSLGGESVSPCGLYLDWISYE